MKFNSKKNLFDEVYVLINGNIHKSKVIRIDIRTFTNNTYTVTYELHQITGIHGEESVFHTKAEAAMKILEMNGIDIALVER